MDSYRHILLAVDFSEDGNYVLRKTKSLADNLRAKLSIIHILDNIPMPDTAYGTAIPLYEISAYELLEEEKSKLMRIGDYLEIDPACRWMIWGVPEQEIIRIANQEHIDLIVVGSHGRHGLALLLGSTTDSVLHRAKCDVLAIHLQDEVASEESVGEGANPITLNPENA